MAQGTGFGNLQNKRNENYRVLGLKNYRLPSHVGKPTPYIKINDTWYWSLDFKKIIIMGYWESEKS